MDAMFFAAEGFDWTNILIAIAAVAVIIIILKVLKANAKRLFRIGLNAALGCLILFGFSLIPGVEFTVVWWHAVVTGIFGIPAAIILIVVSLVT